MSLDVTAGNNRRQPQAEVPPTGCAVSEFAAYHLISVRSESLRQKGFTAEDIASIKSRISDLDVNVLEHRFYQPNIEQAAEKAINLRDLSNKPVVAKYGETLLIATAEETKDSLRLAYKQHRDAVNMAAYARFDANLAAVDMRDRLAPLNWLQENIDEIDGSNHQIVINAFRTGGYTPGMNAGNRHEPDNCENVKGWIIGSCLQMLQEYRCIDGSFLTPYLKLYRDKFLSPPNPDVTVKNNPRQPEDPSQPAVVLPTGFTASEIGSYGLFCYLNDYLKQQGFTAEEIASIRSRVPNLEVGFIETERFGLPFEEIAKMAIELRDLEKKPFVFKYSDQLTIVTAEETLSSLCAAFKEKRWAAHKDDVARAKARFAAGLAAIDMRDPIAPLNWLQENFRSIENSPSRIEQVMATFSAGGHTPGMNAGNQHNPNNQENVKGWIIGTCLKMLQEDWSIDD